MKYICVYLFQPNACKDDVWNQLRNLVDDDKLELCEDMGSFYCNSAQLLFYIFKLQNFIGQLLNLNYFQTDMYDYRQDINQKYINRLLSLICPEVLMLLVDVVKKKIYLHLKHLHLSCVRSRQLSPEHIKYRNRKPADIHPGLDWTATNKCECEPGWMQYVLVRL